MQSSHRDVLIIGTGQAGPPLAARLAADGTNVLIVERHRVGGTCVNYGCTPTKTMVASARAAHVARNAARLGVHVGSVTVDLGAVVDRKERLVKQWQDSVYRKLASGGDRIELLRGHARFVAPRTVDVGGVHYSADAVVINAGARPYIPQIPGLDRVAWLDNRTVMELRELPAHLIVLGGGFVGCEMGQLFRRLGADVTIVDVAARLLAREDAEVSDAIERAFRDEGIRLELGRGASTVSSGVAGAVVVTLSDGMELSGSHVLVAVGRRPNTDDMGCDAAGIGLDDRGYIVVDDAYRTTAAQVYAAGDVTGGPQFTHTAWDDHRQLHAILRERPARPRSTRLIPHVTFTDPQVAGVGLTERQAQERGVAYEVMTLPFGHVARAIETDERAGVIRILIDPATERVLGSTIVGAEAGELIHIVAAIMAAGASARVLVDMQFAHPAFAEGVQSVLLRMPRFAL